MKILITGGAGFVGSNLAIFLKQHSAAVEIVALDNLRRRGSELNIAKLQKHGVEFVYGDIRQASDLDDLKGHFDLMIEASAEPSVLAGLDGSPAYTIQTNLIGTLNCLEFARRCCGGLIFLSTSRVYSIAPLAGLRLVEKNTRFDIETEQTVLGASAEGIAENFPVHLPRSIYGATKLASELMIQEYADTYHLPAVINRCGVIAGPGQFGKVDQGVFTLWVVNHYFGKPLHYKGFGGTGKQVRDLLHPADLFSLIQSQMSQLNQCRGDVYNVGGGQGISTSLLELTEICQDVIGRKVIIGSVSETSPVDIPWYVSDSRLVSERFGWKPNRSIRNIVSDIHTWVRGNEELLRPLFG